MQHIDASLFADENTEFTVKHRTGSVWLSIGETGNDVTIFASGNIDNLSAEYQLRWLYEKAMQVAEDCKALINELNLDLQAL